MRVLLPAVRTSNFPSVRPMPVALPASRGSSTLASKLYTANFSDDDPLFKNEDRSIDGLVFHDAYPGQSHDRISCLSIPSA